jgi:hypothetical protein
MTNRVKFIICAHISTCFSNAWGKMRNCLALLCIASIVLASVVVAGASIDTISPSPQPTKRVFNAPHFAWGRQGDVGVDGYLTTSSGAGIGNATIHAQRLEDGDVWTTFLNVTTDAKGYFSFSVTPRSAPPGTDYYIINNYRVTYDGDSQYAPSVSNEVEMDVFW